MDGVERSYLLATPPPEGDGPAALILQFHGFAGSGEDFDSLTGMSRVAPPRGVVVASPDGGNGTWQIDAAGTDAAFVDALIGEIFATHCIDLDRVYATGFSAGAAFAILYACAHQETVAAIATVAVEFQLGCTEPMPILAFHGTDDPMVPFEDGATGLSLPGVKVRGTELNMGDWAVLGRCGSPPERDRLGTEATRLRWPGCADAIEVVLNRIEGGGHTWPGADPARSSGLTTTQIDATEEIVDFFGGHRLDGSGSAGHDGHQN